jgi:hypothetical protein
MPLSGSHKTNAKDGFFNRQEMKTTKKSTFSAQPGNPVFLQRPLATTLPKRLN